MTLLVSEMVKEGELVFVLASEFGDARPPNSFVDRTRTKPRRPRLTQRSLHPNRVYVSFNPSSLADVSF